MNTASHDDSGIGIRTPEEDFPVEKFAFAQGDGQDLMVGAELHNSDTAI